MAKATTYPQRGPPRFRALLELPLLIPSWLKVLALNRGAPPLPVSAEMTGRCAAILGKAERQHLLPQLRGRTWVLGTRVHS